MFPTTDEVAANIIECLVNFKQNKRCLQKVCHFLAKIGKQVQRFSGKLIGCRKQLILVREENNNTLKERIQRIQSRYHIVAMEKMFTWTSLILDKQSVKNVYHFIDRSRIIISTFKIYNYFFHSELFKNIWN